MADVFLFDALADADVLRVVLGRAVVPGPEVVAEGFEVLRDVLPVLGAAPGGAVAGRLVQGLDAGDLDRLTFFVESATARMQRIDLPGGAALALVGPGDAIVPGREALWLASYRRAAVEVMAFYGRLSATDLAPLRPGIFRRAWSWVLAGGGASGGERDLARDVEVLALKRPHLNFFGIEEVDLRHRKHDGTMSAPINRGVLMVGAAAVVLPYDPVRDSVHLIEQFRAPPLLAGAANPWTWEPVAGLIDAGEFPEEAAHREAFEEAGLTLSRLEPAGRVFSSTGSSGEFLHLFIGLCDLSAPAQSGGLASEGEDIRSTILPFDDLMAGIDAMEYVDMPLVTCGLWLARHRARLRA